MMLVSGCVSTGVGEGGVPGIPSPSAQIMGRVPRPGGRTQFHRDVPVPSRHARLRSRFHP